MRRHLTRCALVTLVTVAVVAPEAGADGMGSGWTDGAGVGAEVESETVASRPPVRRRGTGRRSGSRPRCSYEPLRPGDIPDPEYMTQHHLWPARPDVPGSWYSKICFSDDGGSLARLVWVPDRAEPPAVARRALRELQYTALDEPAIGMSPPLDRGAIVNVPLWLWIDDGAWEPTSATATIDGLSVQTTAAPDRVIWSLGTGDEVVCDGAGTPYDPGRPEAEQHSDCMFTYSQAGVFTVTATAEWNVSWTALGTAGGGNLGVVRRSASVEIPVTEIQALNRPPR